MLKDKFMTLINITPAHLHCAIGACPAVYRTDHGTIVLIGRKVASAHILRELSGRVGPDEEVIEIAEEYLSPILNSA